MALTSLELPIDHFRLLGVSPSADAEAVLRALQVRLDHSPEEGFTREALIQRAELLRLSADLLADTGRREEYEAALLQGAYGLEFSSNKEVGGLILLWEANVAYEAFKLASEALQPPQAPALGSSREADLTLVAALACKSASIQEQEDRHYESAAELLQEGIKLLQRMGKLSEQRSSFEAELNSLLPYRILDLLSRDLGKDSSRQEGLRLLNDFVVRRGGLEGKKAFKDQTGLEQPEFELFFQQIRGYLTAQEQIDLFSHWRKKGSKDSGFLCVLSLTAAGFSYRKPERLWEARKRLENLNLDGLDPLPLLGCLDLLLADIDSAKNRFLASPDGLLQDWLSNYPADSLAAFCDYCRDWLRRDVLPGYKDINANNVDLEAWFSDRDVQEFVDRLDRRGLRSRPFSFLSSTSSEDFPSQRLEEEDVSNDVKDNDFKAKTEDRASFKSSLGPLLRRLNLYDFLKSLRDELIKSSRSVNRVRNRFGSIVFILIILMGFSAAFALLFQRYRFSYFQTKQSQVLEAIKKKNLVKESSKDANSVAVLNNEITIFKLLKSNEPNEIEIRGLIESWLSGKAKILLGNEGISLSNIARPKLLKKLNEERNKDIKDSNKQVINTRIISLKIVKRTSKRIEIVTVIDYIDKRYNSAGKIISETKIPRLNVTYILGRDPDAWRLHAYISGS